MSIHDKFLDGSTLYEKTLDRIRTFCAGRRVLCAFSGGKDSQVCYHLLEDAGVPFRAQYSITRFEPPELIPFIRRHYPSVTFRRMYKKSLICEIENKGLPNRWARWCCDSKHAKTHGVDIAVIGIRWEESSARRRAWRMFGFQRDRTAYLCPIVDWTSADVWEYLGERPHCCLYDQGYNRIGCACCPLSPNSMASDARRYPKTAAMLRMGADKYVAKMRRQGFTKLNGNPCSDWCKASSPEDEYFARWIATGQTAKPIAGDIMEEDDCLFAGTGFSEADGREDEDESVARHEKAIDK